LSCLLTFLTEVNKGDGKKKKLLGVVWMTATMRRNFELFGGYICLDMMKRKLNTLLWPYTAVTMYDENMKICLACEGILCGERYDMYKFLADFLGESAPYRPLSNVNIVAGDGFFDQQMIEDLGFVNAHYITDQWHLFDSGLQKMFGNVGYTILKHHLVKMVKATSEDAYEETLRSAYALLREHPSRDGQMEKDLTTFASRRQHYAAYCIANIPGNLGRSGNAISESNHSSALAHLNEGNKKGNSYCEHPIGLIRDLLRRQKNHTANKNKELFADAQKMRVAVSNLEHQPSTDETKDLLKAAHKLGRSAYERYSNARYRTSDYRVDHHYQASQDLSQPLCVAVFSNISNEPPILFLDRSSRCMCQERLANEDMCPHEILAKGGFDESFFEERHFARESVSGSTVGWVEEESKSIDDMLGYEPENIPQTNPSLPIGVSFSSSSEDAEAEGEMGVVDDPVSPQAHELTRLPSAQAHLPKKRLGKIEPMRTKRVKNVLDNTSASYNRLTEEEKFKVSGLILQLEDLLSSTAHSTTLTTKTHHVIVPTNSCLVTQPKNRLMPAHEHAAKAKKKLKSCHEVEFGHVVQANQKAKRSSCSFCGEPHVVTNCYKRLQYIASSKEYILTTEDQLTGESLIQRIENMPVTEGCGKGAAPHKYLAKDVCGQNFIINECRSMENKSKIYCVSFIGKNGDVTLMDGNPSPEVWITSAAMTSITNHLLKKKKYVYDRTILSK